MKPLKKAIILCWIMLVVCFSIKLFGGNWFEIVCTNEHFSNICKFIDERILLKYLIAFFVYVIPSYFIIKSCCFGRKFNKTNVSIVLIALTIVWFSQFISISLKSFLEIINTIATPFAINVLSEKQREGKIKAAKKYWYSGFLCCFLIFLFQFVSLITRNIGIKVIHDSTLISAIMLVDYYIMIALYYFYSKMLKGEN